MLREVRIVPLLSFGNWCQHTLWGWHKIGGFTMKKLALAATAVAALSGQALAADMPMKAARPAPVVAAVSWTGCYVGGGGGYGMYYQEHRGFDEGRPVNPNSPFAVRTQITDTMKVYERDVLKDVTWHP